MGCDRDTKAHILSRHYRQTRSVQIWSGLASIVPFIPIPLNTIDFSFQFFSHYNFHSNKIRKEKSWLIDIDTKSHDSVNGEICHLVGFNSIKHYSIPITQLFSGFSLCPGRMIK